MNYIEFAINPGYYFRVVTSEGVYVGQISEYEGSYCKLLGSKKMEIYNYLLQADDKTVFEVLERQYKHLLCLTITADEPFHVVLIDVDHDPNGTIAQLSSSTDNWAEGERMKSVIKKFNKENQEEE